jgi:hypothetical protein
MVITIYINADIDTSDVRKAANLAADRITEADPTIEIQDINVDYNEPEIPLPPTGYIRD